MTDLDDGRPLVIGHRGAPSRFPEHSAPGYLAAIDEGADVIEVDVVPCADSTLVARHDTGLARTTDVTTRRDLAQGRSARRTAHGDTQDWWADEMTAAQVTSLRCRERWPDLRPASASHDDLHSVLTLTHVMRLARHAATEQARPVGVAIELKDVEANRARGLDPVSAVVEHLVCAGLPSEANPVWVMAFEASALRRLHAHRDRGDLPGLRLVQLAETGPPADEASWDGVAAHADVVGLALGLVVGDRDAEDPGPVKAARARGLDAWTWTLRGENAFLPRDLRRGANPGEYGDVAAVVRKAAAAGVAGLITDQPDLVQRALS